MSSQPPKKPVPRSLNIKKQPEPNKNRKRLALALVLFFTIFGICWWAWSASANSNLSHVKDLQKEAFNKDLSDEERKQKFAELREAHKNLSPEQKEQLKLEGAIHRERRMSEQAKKFCDLATEAEKTKFLDEQIQREQAMRKQWANKGGRGGKGGGPGGGGQGGAGGQGGGGRRGGQGGQGGQAQANANGNNQGQQGQGQNGNAQGGQQQQGGWKGGNPESRDNFRKNMLNNVTPEQRAQTDVYRQAMSDRKKALGISGGGGPGGFGGPR